MIIKPSTTFLSADTDPQVIVDCSSITTAMEKSAEVYTDPKPTLIVCNTGITEFGDALNAAAGGGRQLTSVKNQKRAALVGLFRLLASYVTVACLGDMAKLLSSGFPVQQPTRQPAALPAVPVAPVVTQSAYSGSLDAATMPVKGAYAYNWQASLASAPDVVVASAQSTKTFTTLDGFTPGLVYLVEVNALGTVGTSEWSTAVAMMVI